MTSELSQKPFLFHAKALNISNSCIKKVALMHFVTDLTAHSHIWIFLKHSYWKLVMRVGWIYIFIATLFHSIEKVRKLIWDDVRFIKITELICTLQIFLMFCSTPKCTAMLLTSSIQFMIDQGFPRKYYTVWTSKFVQWKPPRWKALLSYINLSQNLYFHSTYLKFFSCQCTVY